MATKSRLAPTRRDVKMFAPQFKALFCDPRGGTARMSRIMRDAGFRAMPEEGELVLLYFKKPSAKNGAKKPGGRGNKKR